MSRAVTPDGLVYTTGYIPIKRTYLEAIVSMTQEHNTVERAIRTKSLHKNQDTQCHTQQQRKSLCKKMPRVEYEHSERAEGTITGLLIRGP